VPPKARQIRQASRQGGRQRKVAGRLEDDGATKPDVGAIVPVAWFPVPVTPPVLTGVDFTTTGFDGAPLTDGGLDGACDSEPVTE